MKVFYNFLILCIFNVSLSKSKHKKKMSDSASSEGDKLIEKIISADRFNDLADKIVDKAIWKLNHMNSGSGITPETKKYPAHVNNPSLNTREERSKKKDQKRHKTAIDVEAVLKRKVIPLADLSFRYDHFIKGSNTFVSKSAKNKKNLRQDSSRESTEKSLTKSKEVLKSRENSSSEAKDENDKNKNKIIRETSNVDENKMHTENVSNIVNSTNKDEITKPKLQSAENQFGDEKVIVWGKRDESGDKSDSDVSDEKKGKKNNEKTSNESDEIDEPYHKRAEAVNKTSSSKDNDVENLINKDVLQDKALGIKQLQLEHDELFKKSKNLIRREGDKKFTFEKSPDYAEYHEKLAQVRKTFIKNVT